MAEQEDINYPAAMNGAKSRGKPKLALGEIQRESPQLGFPNARCVHDIKE